MNNANNSTLDTAKAQTQSILASSGSLSKQACLMTLPDISMPTGKKTVKKKELTLHDGRKITSNKLTGGAIEWFPQDKLADFGTLRKQAYKVFEEKSVCVGGMYLVSLENVDLMLSEMKRIEHEWELLVKGLDYQFDALMSDYKSLNPDIESIITDYALARGEFMSVFKFNVLPPLAVQPLFPEQEEQIAKSAIESLWSEIGKEAGKQYNTSFNKGENVSQKAVTALKRIRDKLTDMSFLTDGVDLVVETFDSVINRLPKTGKIEGTLFHELGHFVLQLSDENRLKATATGEDENGLNIAAFYKSDTSNADFDDAAVQVDFEPSFAPSDEFDDEIVSSSFDEPVILPQQSQTAQTTMDWMDF